MRVSGYSGLSKLFATALKRGDFEVIDLPWHKLNPDKDTLKRYLADKDLIFKVLYRSWFESDEAFAKAIEAVKDCPTLYVREASINGEIAKALALVNKDSKLYIQQCKLIDEARSMLLKRGLKTTLHDVEKIKEAGADKQESSK